jgi:hypothetical protein
MLKSPWKICLLATVVAGSLDAAEPTRQGRPEWTYGSSKSTTEFSFVADSPIKIGAINLGDIETTHWRIRYGQSFPVSKKVSLRAGVEWERYDFGRPAATPIPSRLQSAVVNLGMDWRIADRWILQTEVDPGIYSDLRDIDIEDFNAPLSMRLIYAQSEKLAWALALIANPKSEFPFIGGIGARWTPTEDLRVDIILPRPQIAYQVSPEVGVFAGAEFKGGGYRVAEDFGNPIGRPDLNDQDVFYREVRTGGGVRWKVTEKIAAIIEGGWVIDRRFRFVDRDLQLNGDGAPYFQIALKGTY